MNNASLMKRLAVGLYELLSLLAIWLLSTFVFVMLVGDADTALARFCLQLTLWLVAGAYFIICWQRTGQTLAAQAWKIKLVNVENSTLGFQQAMLRYVLASASVACFGLGLLWAVVDREQIFLHDRLLKTRLINLGRD